MKIADQSRDDNAKSRHKVFLFPLVGEKRDNGRLRSLTESTCDMQIEKTNPISAHREGKTSGRCLPSRSIRASSDSSIGEQPGNDGDATCSFISEDAGRSESDEQTGDEEIVGSMMMVAISAIEVLDYQQPL